MGGVGKRCMGVMHVGAWWCWCMGEVWGDRPIAIW